LQLPTLLQEDGRLRLATFEYRISLREWQEQRVDELIEGDFWMVMKPAFKGQRTYIPFREGLIVEDREQWFTEEPFNVRTARQRAGE
jgi:hypothetical protein